MNITTNYIFRGTFEASILYIFIVGCCINIQGYLITAPRSMGDNMHSISLAVMSKVTLKMCLEDQGMAYLERIGSSPSACHGAAPHALVQ